MSQQKKSQSTCAKALAINLDAQKYGVFAEIGAGQETANWFFRTSGTAGTVAKTISAYDMTMSDALYGKTSRYVSEERLQSMLKYEYALLKVRLSQARGDTTTFFSFCNTVRARGYQDSGECHGWLGIRLQLKPNTAPCEIVLHLRLLDESNEEQMEALGKVGVNLAYAAFYLRDDLPKFVESLADDLHTGSIEIDMLRFSGTGFEHIDNRLCALELVQRGLTDAAMFNKHGQVVQAIDAFYKRPITLLRGSFNPVLKLHLDMIEQTKAAFLSELTEAQQARSIELCEISTNNLLRDGTVDHDDFINRADTLQALGKTVLISRSAEFHRIATYLSRYTSEPIGIILSIGLLNELFKQKWSSNLPGGILESFGRLFKNNVQLYVYPWHNSKSKQLVTAENFKAPDNWGYLYQHLIQNNRIRPIGVGDPSLLAMTSRKTLKIIESGQAGWEQWIPEAALDIVRKQYSQQNQSIGKATEAPNRSAVN